MTRIKNEGAERLAKWVDAGLRKPAKTVRGLGEALGIDATAVSKMRRGRRRVRADEIATIAEYLETVSPLRDASFTNGSVSVGAVSRTPYSQGSKQSVFVPVMDKRFIGLPQKRWKLGEPVAGIRRGEYVIHVPYWKARDRLHDGDLVVALINRKTVCGTLKRADKFWTVQTKAGRHEIKKDAHLIGLVIWSGRQHG